MAAETDSAGPCGPGKESVFRECSLGSQDGRLILFTFFVCLLLFGFGDRFFFCVIVLAVLELTL